MIEGAGRANGRDGGKLVVMGYTCTITGRVFYIRMHTRTPQHTHTCTPQHTHTHACMHAHTHTCTHTHTHACTHTPTHTCTHTHTHACMHTHTHMYAHTHTHACTHTHTINSSTNRQKKLILHMKLTIIIHIETLFWDNSIPIYTLTQRRR